MKLLDCEANSFFGCLLRKCLDTSITKKLIGMLIVSLVGFLLLTSLNTMALNRIATRTHEVEYTSLPQYKVSQYILRRINGFKISLLHMLTERKEDGNADVSDYVIANRERIADMRRMLSTVQTGGTIYDIAKISGETLDRFHIEAATADSGVTGLLRQVLEELDNLHANFDAFANAEEDAAGQDARESALNDVVDSLDAIYDYATSLTIRVNERHNAIIHESSRIISKSRFHSLIIASAIMVILLLGMALYMMIIVLPLKNILGRVREISSGEGNLLQRIEVRSRDEVGQLAPYLNTPVDNIFSLNSFKAVIEEDESTTEVYKRLAALIRDRFGFDSFFIYETGAKRKMSVAFATDHNQICSEEILDDSLQCRARRTGHTISSFQCADICKKFPYREKMEHYCVPTIAGGQVLGVVQFVHVKGDQPILEAFEKKVGRVMRYIKEAAPVVEAKRFAAVLQETTLKDPMTGLYNRRFLETYVDTLVATSKRRNSKIGILMCDMDFFKEVNDTHGHEAGDVVLIRTAEVLTSCVRASDMVIRFGGEEFLVLLVDVRDKAAVAEIAEKIRATMQDTTIKIADGTLKKTMSIGYCEFPGDAQAFWEAIKYADVALYRAKEDGRNRTVAFLPEMWDKKNF